MFFKFIILSSLLMFNIVFAFSIIYIEHLNRALFRDLEIVKKEEQSLQNEWKKVLIDSREVANPARIEERASEELGMLYPDSRRVIYINE